MSKSYWNCDFAAKTKSHISIIEMEVTRGTNFEVVIGFLFQNHQCQHCIHILACKNHRQSICGFLCPTHCHKSGGFLNDFSFDCNLVCFRVYFTTITIISRSVFEKNHLKNVCYFLSSLFYETLFVLGGSFHNEFWIHRQFQISAHYDSVYSHQTKWKFE